MLIFRYVVLGLTDIFLTIEWCSIVFFNGDAFGLIPRGASHTEEIIFALVLAVWSEVISIKWYDFRELRKEV